MNHLLADDSLEISNFIFTLKTEEKNICNNFDHQQIRQWLQGTGNMKLNAIFFVTILEKSKYFMAREGSDQPLHKTADPGAIIWNPSSATSISWKLIMKSFLLSFFQFC